MDLGDGKDSLWSTWWSLYVGGVFVTFITILGPAWLVLIAPEGKK